MTERTIYFELHDIHNLTRPRKFNQKPNAWLLYIILSDNYC